MSLGASITQGQFPTLADVDAIKLFATEFPELQRLKNAKTTTESAQLIPAGNLGEHHQTPSQLAFGEDFAEVNRTLVSMLGLKWLLADDHAAFTCSQDSTCKLSPDSFHKLRAFFLERLHRPEDISVLLVTLVIGDVGKDPDLAVEVEQATGTSPSNHDEVVYLAAASDMLPSLKKLSTKDREDAVLSLEVGWKLNIGQLAQAENVPGSLTSLANFADHERAFNTRVMEVLLDVAGAGAHEDARCCAWMTEPVFRNYMTTIEFLNDFVIRKTSSERQCYDGILDAKAEALAQKGFSHLSTTTDEERVILRLLAMGRVADKRRAELLQRAFELLPTLDRQRLVDGLNVDGFSGDVAILPYYAPGIFAVVFRVTDGGGSDAVPTRALSALMRFLSRVVGEAKTQTGDAGTIIERDVSFLQDAVKSQEFQTNPDLLDAILLPWRT